MVVNKVHLSAAPNAGRDLRAPVDYVDLSTPGDPGRVLALPCQAPRVIGLCGKAGSGKSTAAAILEGHGFTRLRFAGPLKAMLAAFLSEAGLGPCEIERMLEGDLKEAPCDILGGKSPRVAMQTLGTEWGRQIMDPELWVSAAAARADAILAAGGSVVFEDVRFLNECAAVWDFGGCAQVWAITGRGGVASAHASEFQALQPDHVLDNSGDLEALRAQVAARLLPRGSGTV